MIPASGPTELPGGLVTSLPASCRTEAELDLQAPTGGPGARNPIAACGVGFRPRNPRDGRCVALSPTLGFSLSAGPVHSRGSPTRHIRSGGGKPGPVLCRAGPAGGPALPDLGSAVPTAASMVTDAQGVLEEDLVLDLCPNGEPCIIDGQALVPVAQGLETLNADTSNPLPGTVEVLFVPESEDAPGPPPRSPGDPQRPLGSGPRLLDPFQGAASEVEKGRVRQGVPHTDGGTEPVRPASSGGDLRREVGVEMRSFQDSVVQDDTRSVQDIPDDLAGPREREDGDAAGAEWVWGANAPREVREGVPQEGPVPKRGALKMPPRATVGGRAGRVRAGSGLSLMKGLWQAYKCTTFALVPVTAPLRGGYKAADSLAHAKV